MKYKKQTIDEELPEKATRSQKSAAWLVILGFGLPLALMAYNALTADPPPADITLPVTTPTAVAPGGNVSITIGDIGNESAAPPLPVPTPDPRIEVFAGEQSAMADEIAQLAARANTADATRAQHGEQIGEIGTAVSQVATSSAATGRMAERTAHELAWLRSDLTLGLGIAGVICIVGALIAAGVALRRTPLLRSGDELASEFFRPQLTPAHLQPIPPQHRPSTAPVQEVAPLHGASTVQHGASTVQGQIRRTIKKDGRWYLDANVEPNAAERAMILATYHEQGAAVTPTCNAVWGYKNTKVFGMVKAIVEEAEGRG